MAENVTRVLYPNVKNTYENLEIRLKQEYFLCAASLQDIIRRYRASKAGSKQGSRTNYTHFADRVAIQLNDTRCSLVIPELMRTFVDIEKLSWDEAWKLTTQTCTFTSHSILSDVLEQWPVSLLETLLPRHLEIIYQINDLNLTIIADISPKLTSSELNSFSCVQGEDEKRVDMAYLAVIGSHSVNGVSKFHTNLLKNTSFKQFYELEPKKFHNKTNGVSPRRWLFLSNPALSNVIMERIGDKWPTHLEKLEALRKLSKDPAFQRSISKTKQENKIKLAETTEKYYGISINPSSLFDIQVQMIHGYKRQLLNCLHVITLFNRIKADPRTDVIHRTVFFGGKSEPAYHMGKQIIKLIYNISSVVNNDPVIGDKLKVVFLENYGVTLAEQIIPCADLSEQISVPGYEASGTGSMKFLMNGALTICTMSGANVEIIEQVGADNIFAFGLKHEEIEELKRTGYDPMEYYNENPDLRICIDQIQNGYFNPREPDTFHDLVEELLHVDEYFVMADYNEYVRTQNKVSEIFQVRRFYTIFMPNLQMNA